MKAASQLIYPTKYFAAYKKGKDDAINKRPYKNPYVDLDYTDIAEQSEGYSCGYKENVVGPELVEITD